VPMNSSQSHIPYYDGTNRRLNELLFIDELDKLADAYYGRHGHHLVNVSHWDPSEETINCFRTLFPPLCPVDPICYRYSYLLERMPQVLNNLGFANKDVAGLVTENGTTAIVTVSNWLMLNNIREVILLRPYYFPTLHNIQRLGIRVRPMVLPRVDSLYRLPRNLGLGKGVALWLTNPIYNTGVHSIELDTEELKRIADSGVIVVADEALALRPSPISKWLGGHENFVGIYSPHKAICMNGLKFAVTAFHRKHENSFDDWSDVLSGGLGISAIAAIEHFLTDAYDLYLVAFNSRIEATRQWHSQLLRKHGSFIETDVDAKGHFLSVYFPDIHPQLGEDLEFLEQLIEETGCTILPGNRSGFDFERGFCFRINLAQDSRQFRIALPQLYRFLHQQSLDASSSAAVFSRSASLRTSFTSFTSSGEKRSKP
jgi:aspartate/methionine/tyrosine aminotransferase